MPSLQAIRHKEAAASLNEPKGYQGFDSRCISIRNGLKDFLNTANSEGRVVAAYGAAAKGNTLLNYTHIKAGDIAFVCDSNPAKQDKFLPGSRIPILPPDAIPEHRPDYVLILPWNLRGEISASLAHIRDWGGRFVVAVPGIEVF